MKRIALIFGLFVGASSASFAIADPKVCLDFDDDATRLDCYDNYFEALINSEKIISENKSATQGVAYEFEQANKLILDLEFANLLEYLKKLEVSDTQKEELVVAVEDQVKPLPASNAELNLAGYRVLAYLKPQSDTFAAKAKRYETAVLNSRTKYFRKLIPETDEFKGVTWYSHPDKPWSKRSRSTIYAYIGKRSFGGPFLRMVTNYTADDWLFVKKVQVNVDGEILNLTVADRYRFEGDNSSGDIWEWKDEAPSKTQLNILKKIGEAKKVVIRFTGSQYYDDKNMSSKDITAIKEVLLAFEEMQKNGL